jgi:ribonuclease-3 family protein
VETQLKFNEFQACLRRDLAISDKRLSEPLFFEDPSVLPALILAYVGDAVFSLHARSAMLAVEANKVQVLHTLLARMASAPLQAQALYSIEESLSETEKIVVRRGRNARSRVPRSSSVSEYRSSTGLEALLGYLYLARQQERLEQILQQVVGFMYRSLASEVEGDAKS